MQDPLQLNPGGRNKEEVVIRPRGGTELPLRAYPIPTAPVVEADDLATLMQYLWLLWKRKWILLLAMTLGTLISVALVLRMTPLYHARTMLEIQTIPEPNAPPAMSESSTDTQIQLLNSLTMRKRALAKVQEKPDLAATTVEGPLMALRSLLKLKDPAKTIPWNDASALAAGMVSTRSTKENSAILVIQTDSWNPLVAAAYTDTLAQEYIKYTQEQRVLSYQNSGLWMTNELQTLKSKIESTEQQLAQFAREKGLIFTDAASGTSGTRTVGEEKLKSLQAELQAATADQIKVQSKNEADLPSSGGPLPAGVDSNNLAALQGELTTQKAELARLRTTLTDRNDKVQEVLNKIAVIEAAMASEKTNIVGRSQRDITAADNRVNKLTREFELESQRAGKQSDDLITYNIRQRENETNKKLYDSMFAEGKQASMAAALRSSSAHVIDVAVVPTEPIRPSLPFSLTLGIMGGLCCGAGFVIVRSRMDLTIKDPGVLEVEFNVRELGVIPSARTDQNIRNLRAFSGAIRSAVNGKRLASPDCLELVANIQTPSLMAEAYRSAMTSILFSSEPEDQARVIVFTSAASGEGKTTVISNLAISLAQTNHRVLLVDADMRLPRAHGIFDVPNNFGLSDVLHERTPVEDYIEESLVRKTRIPNLYILPAGPTRTNMSRLIHSKRMQELMNCLRDSFDFILIDTPPVLVVPDSRLFARAADAVVLVVRANRTHQNAAFAAANCFVSDGTRILGTILNDWNPSMSNQAYGGYYGQGGYGGYDKT